MANHVFNIDHATLYGLNEAILIHHFQYWISYNRRQNVAFHDGKTWMYQSRKEMVTHFPYWTLDQIRDVCERLVHLGVLVTANYNKSPLNKTLWYAFKDEDLFVPSIKSNNSYERGISHMERGNSQIVPNDPTYSIKISKEDVSSCPTASISADAEELTLLFLSKIKERNSAFKDPNLKKWTTIMDYILRIDNRSPDQVKSLIVWVSHDSFWSSVCLSTDNLRKNFDKILAAMARTKEKDRIQRNLDFALEQKKKYPEYLKDMGYNEKCVFNRSNSKDISLDLPEETFLDGLANLFGGKKR